MAGRRMLGWVGVLLAALSVGGLASGRDATPGAASPAATPAGIVLVESKGRYELSGTGVVGLSEPFALDEGNWFFTVEATGTGELTAFELVQIGGDSSEFLIGVGSEPLPYRDEGVLRILKIGDLDRTGDYVLSVDATDPETIEWRVVISRTPAEID